VIFLGNCESVILYGKRNFADGIKLRISDYLMDSLQSQGSFQGTGDGGNAEEKM
jgi:hypothetical protein